MTDEEINDGAIPDDVESLIQEYLDETIDEAGMVLLQEHLRGSAKIRNRFREATATVALLREEALLRKSEVTAEKKERRAASRFSLLVPLGVFSAVVLLAAFIFPFKSRPATVAKIAKMSDASWLSPAMEEGEAIVAGSQLQLASGQVEIVFESGAVSHLEGPALFEVASANEGFLHYGKAYSVAENEESKGFTIRTASGTYVDQGTEFITEATADGYSQMLVLEGAVDADASGFGTRRIQRGNGIGFDPGETPIMIQIEQGSETRAFEFPTIPPPSGSDFASTNPIVFEIDSRGRSTDKSILAPPSGPLEVLVNGRTQRNHDDPDQSLFFRNDTTGYLIFDLGRVIPVTSIHTYSWHRNKDDLESTLRAVQRYTLWGARENRPAGLPGRKNSGGWERIARVDTDVFFQVDERTDRPSQQACRLLPAEGAIGEFRYLLFEVLPTIDIGADAPRHTFFSEIDIFSGE